MFGFLGRNPKTVPVPFVFDADALTWFNYAGLTGEAEKQAFNTFVLSAKAHGYWSKLLYMNYFSPKSFAAALKDCVGLSTGTAAGGLSSSNVTPQGMNFNGVEFIKTGKYPDTIGITTSSYYNLGMANLTYTGNTGGVTLGSYNSDTQRLYISWAQGA